MEVDLDHVAVPSRDIAASVAWYRDKFGAEVLYQDQTWAFLRLGRGKLALVTPSQHPPHLAVRLNDVDLMQAAQAAGRTVDRHRDGTQGLYLSDPDGNQVELICYPAGHTVYEQTAERRGLIEKSEKENSGNFSEGAEAGGNRAAAGTGQQPVTSQ